MGGYQVGPIDTVTGKATTIIPTKAGGQAFQALYYLSSFFNQVSAVLWLCIAELIWSMLKSHSASCAAPSYALTPVFLPNATLQFGPNATTWLVAGEIFPTDIRAGYHGFAACMSKLGAITSAIWISYTNTTQWGTGKVSAAKAEAALSCRTSAVSCLPMYAAEEACPVLTHAGNYA